MRAPGALAALLALVPAGLVGCDAEPRTAVVERAVVLPEPLAETYARSCALCHETGLGAAPRRGDREAWAERIAGGIDRMTDRTIDGYKDMPPLGHCMECSLEEFEALIRWMVQLAAPEA